MTYYGTRFGCKFGKPHDFVPTKETKTYKIERCQICNVRRKWNKGFHGRVDNPKYLKDHVRNFAQEFGATKRVYNKLYHPEKTIIHL